MMTINRTTKINGVFAVFYNRSEAFLSTDQFQNIMQPKKDMFGCSLISLPDFGIETIEQYLIKIRCKWIPNPNYHYELLDETFTIIKPGMPLGSNTGCLGRTNSIEGCIEHIKTVGS